METKRYKIPNLSQEQYKVEMAENYVAFIPV